jgi:hypothetical protein
MERCAKLSKVLKEIPVKRYRCGQQLKSNVAKVATIVKFRPDRL